MSTNRKTLAIMALAAGLAGLTGGALASGNVENGKKVATEHNCASCHGVNLNKPIDPTYPKLAGQHYDYLVQALRAYQIENSPLVGRQNAIMKAQTQPLKHSEIDDLAAYISSLPGDLVLEK